MDTSFSQKCFNFKFEFYLGGNFGIFFQILPAVGTIRKSDDTGGDSDKERSDSARVDILSVKQSKNDSDQNPGSYHLIKK